MPRPRTLLLLLGFGALVACQGRKDGDSSSTPTETDQDNDGYTSEEDCNDTNPAINPSASEVCDGQDNDCDGATDENVSTPWYADADGDGYGDPATISEACDRPPGYVPIGNDCDDTNAEAWPGRPEICDGFDNDCDGSIDEDATSVWYTDADGDGFGDDATGVQTCDGGSGTSDVGGDCNDTDASIHPDADEICDGADNDCDGQADEAESVDVPTWYYDNDGDGYGDPSTVISSCRHPPGTVDVGDDCNDADAAINPAVLEYCDGIDNNCDGVIDEDSAADAPTWYRDADSDGYGNPALSTVQCDAPPGFIAEGTDCDDSIDAINPGATEYCDSLDNDCDGLVDDSPVDGATWYPDLDSDGFGDPAGGLFSCTPLSGWATNGGDCDDSDPSNPIAVDGTLGSPSGDGSVANPVDTVQAGIDLSTGCVIVWPGTYTEQVDFGGKSLDVRGLEGSERTILDPGLTTCTTTNPEACGAVVTMASSSGVTSSLSGFTLRGGTGAWTLTFSGTTCGDSMTGYFTCGDWIYEYCGGGLFVSGDNATLTDVVIVDNALPPYAYSAPSSYDEIWMYSFGGGICAINANLVLDDVAVWHNYADSGGGLYAANASTVDMAHTYVTHNEGADGGGAFLDSSSLTVTNTVFACNQASGEAGGLLLEGTGATANVDNVTFFGDQSTAGTTSGAAIWGDTAATLVFSNSIAQVDVAAWALYGTGSGSFNYNDVYNTASGSYTIGGAWVGGTGSISLDPLFKGASCDGDPTNDDFGLGTGSPAIDAGKPYSSYYDTDGTRNDLGAFGGPEGSWTP